MMRIATWMLAGHVLMLALAAGCSAAEELTADQIVEKNVAARGGLEAWHKVQSMAWFGHIESANAPVPSMPFSLAMARPNKTRFELMMQNQAAINVFDGVMGWKLRQANGKPELKPYTSDEVSYARDGQGIGGPLIDYAAKGIAIKLEGMDEIEGRKAYRLSVRFSSGISQQVWVDAQTYLDIKSERELRGRFGRVGKVSVYYRNYQTIDNLRMPMLIETYAGASQASDKMVIARILLNPPVDARMFAKPGMPGQSGMAGADHADRPVPRRPARPDARSVLIPGEHP